MARPDPMLERIEAFTRSRGGGVVVRRAAHGYSLYSERTGGPVARLKPTGRTDIATSLTQVLSHAVLQQ